MKTKSTLLILFISFCMMADTLHAQMGQGKPEEITDMKQRKLIVVLMPENHAVIEKLTKKGHADLIPKYQKIISDFNENLKIVFDNNWPYKQEVEY